MRTLNQRLHWQASVSTVFIAAACAGDTQAEVEVCHRDAPSRSNHKGLSRASLHGTHEQKNLSLQL
jgi:hypothetical protein